MSVSVADEPAVARPSWWRRFLASYLQPLIFIIGFPLAFGSALHAPAPHDMPLLLVGPSAVVADAATGLDQTAEFAVTHTDNQAAAEDAVRERDVLGSILITPVQDPASPTSTPQFTVTTYIAGGAGLAASGTVRQVGAQLAAKFGTTAGIVDVAPLAVEDGTGTGLFFLLTYVSLGGYLVIISLMQFLPGARLRTRYLAAAINAVGAPLLVFGISSLYLGDYGAGFGSIMALLGVGSLYVFTISAIAILIQQFLGKAATVGVMAIIVFLGFPGSGGAIPASMMPGFWRGVHEAYFSSAAMESFRSIIYFSGNGMGRWLLQLAAWTVGIVLLTVIVHLRRTIGAQRRELLLRERFQPAPRHVAALTSGPDRTESAEPATKHLASTAAAPTLEN